jgi:acyl-CoA thioester hydrolase
MRARYSLVRSCAATYGVPTGFPAQHDVAISRQSSPGREHCVTEHFPGSYELRLRVEPKEIDEQGHVSNVVYVQWMQDAAWAHWRAVASAEAQATVAWAAMRHEIDYDRPALLGDEILVRTWVGPASGLTFERRTEIYRVADMQLLVHAKTLWCPIDPQTLKPKRVSAEVRRQFSSDAAGVRHS